MDDRFSRTQLLFGKESMERLYASKVAVFGIGGVGGYVVEALARSGVGGLDLFDNDKICLSNFNRQIIATAATLGRYKVDAAKERVLEINPGATVNAHRLFYLPETSGQADLSVYDYVVDAIDTAAGKIELAVQATSAGVPIISSMGAGNKVSITAFEVDDIYNTSVCPLAKVMRTELRKRGVPGLKVVYSKEPAIRPAEDAPAVCKEYRDFPDFPVEAGDETLPRRRQVPGSNAFVPPSVGLIIAGEVIKDLTGKGMNKGM